MVDARALGVLLDHPSAAVVYARTTFARGLGRGGEPSGALPALSPLAGLHDGTVGERETQEDYPGPVIKSSFMGASYRTSAASAGCGT